MQKLEIKLSNSEVISGNNVLVPGYYNEWRPTDLYYSTEEYKVPIVKDLSFLKDKSRIYFLENSQFPRFKLQANNYINARNSDKAAIAVIGSGLENLGREDPREYTIIEGDSCYFLIRGSEINYMFRDANYNRVSSDEPEDVFNWLLTNHFIPASSKIIYTGKLYLYDKRQFEFADELKKLSCPITTDYILDLHISSGLELLDANSLSEIKALLESPDATIRGTALKMMASSNYYTHKYQVKYLLKSFNNLTICPEWNSVSCKYMRKMLKLDMYTDYSVNSLHDLTKVFNSNIGSPSKEDEDFMREKLLSTVKNELSNTSSYLSGYLDSVFLSNPIKLTLTAE
jgi:hypothetical protein